MNNPYRDLKYYNFWYKAMTAPAPGHIDPVVSYKKIAKTDKVSTMGSCFAQHLSKNIAKAGFNYFVAEEAQLPLDDEEAKRRNYGIFSARYGNVYTARQALQLFDRAFGEFIPNDNIWLKNDKHIDAFRPQIEPDGYLSKENLLEDRSRHLSCVRRIFASSDWLIFTLGLTEGWRSKDDGAVFPLAPGVSGGAFDSEKHEFVNFSAREVVSDLRDLIRKMIVVNDKINIILTVSPVPLIATYENRHVWVSTTLSKAVLRVAADEIEKEFANVIYFPSYEIITSPANMGRYYADDLRQVTDIGVNHVMRMFSRHFMNADCNEGSGDSLRTFSNESDGLKDIVCDEEEIERAIRQSGF